jgi:hypothetical protein
MRILINAYCSGLGNNGGTKTIIRSAETLTKLGHTVHILANINVYSWHKHKITVMPEIRSYDYDCVIAASLFDLRHTLEMPIINKVYWCRLWETHLFAEAKVVDRYKEFVSSGGRMLANSSWLCGKMKQSCGINAQLCFAGLDLNVWKDNGTRDRLPHIAIGGLYHRHTRKRWDVFKHIVDSLPAHYAVNIIGSDVPHVRANLICSDGNYNELLNFYNQTHIYIATTELEGFHQVPAEAALCGCHIICNNKISNGMSDYANEETADIIDFDNANKHLQFEINSAKVQNMQYILTNNIGNRERNMRKLVEYIG